MYVPPECHSSSTAMVSVRLTVDFFNESASSVNKLIDFRADHNIFHFLAQIQVLDLQFDFSYMPALVAKVHNTEMFQLSSAELCRHGKKFCTSRETVTTLSWKIEKYGELSALNCACP